MSVTIYLVEQWNEFFNLDELNILANSIEPELIGYPYILYSLLQVVTGQSGRECRIEEVERFKLCHILEAEHIREEYFRYVVADCTDFFRTMDDFSSLGVGQLNRIERSRELRLKPILQCPTVLAHTIQKWPVRYFLWLSASNEPLNGLLS